MKIQYLFLFLIFFLNNNLFALGEGYFENVNYKKINNENLVNAIGVLTLSFDSSDTPKMNLYKFTGKKNQYEIETLIYVNKTIPISQGKDYSSFWNRYIILKKINNWILILYDSIHNKKAWIKFDAYNDENNKIIMFNNLVNLVENVDPFNFIRTDNIKLYSNINDTSNYTILKYNENDNPLKIIKQKGSFIEIAYEILDEEKDELFSYKKLGWIKIRDDKNRILIWLYSYLWF